MPTAGLSGGRLRDRSRVRILDRSDRIARPLHESVSIDRSPTCALVDPLAARRSRRTDLFGDLTERPTFVLVTGTRPSTRRCTRCAKARPTILVKPVRPAAVCAPVLGKSPGGRAARRGGQPARGVFASSALRVPWSAPLRPCRSSTTRAILPRRADRAATVLIQGESGIREGADRRDGASLEPAPEGSVRRAQLRGAVSPQLIESELFGRTSGGASTGASRSTAATSSKPAAGTLFLARESPRCRSSYRSS
jgi:hypothetical protein